MVISPNEWKILKYAVKLQTNKKTSAKQLLNLYPDMNQDILQVMYWFSWPFKYEESINFHVTLAIRQGKNPVI